MGTFKLGKMTFGSLFKKPETIQYPYVTKPQPEGLKGHIVNDVYDCILCGLCDRSCPTNSITVDKQGSEWTINPFSCIQCGYCITVCPKACLSMDPNYWAAAPVKEIERFTIPAQKVGKHAAKPEQSKKKAEVEAAPAKEEMPKQAEQAAPTAKEETVDQQLLTLIALMPEEKAKIVESALKAR